MSFRRFALALIASPLLMAGQAATAAEPGWYYGASGGQSQADISQAALDEFADFFFASGNTPLIASTSTLEDSDTAWSLFFGYRFSPFLAAEAGYLDLGAFPYELSGTASPSSPAGFGFEFKSAGFTMAVLGILPLGPLFELNARIGGFFSETDATFSARLDDQSIRDTFGASATDFFYGLGASINLGERWAFRVDWQQIKKVGDDEITTEEDVDLLMATILFRLGAF